MQKTLKDFKPGEYGTVEKVNVTGAVRRRLFDMGITNGVGIKMRKVAPMGDPIELTLRGYALSIRKSEAAAILMNV